MSSKTIAQSRAFVNPGLEFGATSLSGVTYIDANYGYGGTFNAGSTRTSPWYTTHNTSTLCTNLTGTVGACHPIEVWTSGYLGFTAAEGNNFVELNAAEASMIYQNMYLSPGDVVKGSFKHRARSSANEQAKWVVEDQSGTEIGVVATTTVPTVTNAWRTYTGNYTFTGTAGIYRVGFRAVTGGTVGNFLDDIQIFTSPIIDLKNSIALSACEGNSNGTLFLRINGRVESNTTVAVELQNPNNGNPFASPADITLTPVANSMGTASISRSGNIYLISIPPGDYDGGITPGYSSPSNNEDGVRININSVSDAINEPTETFRFEIKSAGTNGASSNFSAGAPVSGDTYYPQTDNYFINLCDRDGDGVPDSIDLDNDNDGILDTNECYGEKINNGSFDSNANGWTFNSAVWGHAGARMSTTNDSSSNSPLTQNLNPLSTQLYKLSFTLAASDFGDSDTRTASLTVRLGGVVYGVFNNGTGKTDNVTLTLSNGATSDFSPFSTPGNGEASRNVVIYLPYTYSSAQTNAIDFIVSSNGDDWFLDNISLMGGCDTDGDGIPNYLDLDSDNDGCLDALEGDDKVLISDLVSAGGSLTVGNGSTASNQNLCANGTCVDSQGVPIIVNPGGSADLDGVRGQGKGSSANATVFACKDSDGDGIPDIYDLDDDNDGIPDCDENGFKGPVSSYFKLNGSAFDSSFYEITLTPATNSQSGQAWSKGKVDFSKSFKLRFEANLGSNAGGADGIAIVFQNDPNGINATGANGNGIGARGIQNGLALELDTYSNTTAPASDPGGSNGHGRIWRTVDQSNLTNNIELGNLKDGNWRDVEIVWDVDTQNITYYVNGTNAGSYTFSSGGITNQIFGGESKVYFGYTASTGALNNLQRVRFVDPCIDLPLELDTDGDGIPDYLDLDSDNDGCLDALEGGDNVITSQLVSASVGLSVGTGSSASNQNLCADGSCVDAQGVPTVVNAGGAADIDGAQGQSIGSSKDEELNSCLNFCTTGCNDNTYLNSVDPNTIEYDNIVSVFHATIIKEKDGVFKGWGEGITPNGTDQLTPIEITPANGYNYTGTPLHATGTSIGIETSQFALLTTTGLYSWGRSTNLLFPTSVKNSTPFASVSIGTEGIPGTKADGLPAGVAPQDVKMMYGTHGTLAIVTCSGNAWVLSFVGAKSGNGSTSDAGNNVWKRVKTSATSTLKGVVALRGSSYALMALTQTGKVYTWGKGTLLGDGSAELDRYYATEMILPSGATPKMIGLTRNINNFPSYFLLATDGKLYTVGRNNRKQLGDGTTTDRLAWVQPQKPASQGQGTGPLTDIAWISPNEHDGSNSLNSLSPFSVLTNQGKLWSWGFNDTFMIGGPAAALYDPLYMPGGLDTNDKITAVETGGHTTMIWKDGGTKFGYVGHRINGSMADGVVASEVEPIYNFETAELDICGVPVTPPTNFCITGCNNNTYVNAVDPNTIEYDNIIGLYHSTIAKEADGTLKIWGQGVAYNGTGITGNILTPQVINSTNYPGLTGDILKFAGASRGNNQQFSVLTTTGLFVWGDTDILVPTDVKNTNVFGSIAVGTYGVAGTKADGLPAGVAPGDVKMMFGTERTLSLVTCSGEAWMLSRQGYLYGDGTTDNSANDMVWHRVSTSAGVPLTNVVAARGAYYGMMALTSNGEIYTWGRDTRLGNNTAPADRLYATLMAKPSGVTPKMIGMTYQYVASTNELTYYLLGTNGNLYSMGANHDRQLGNGTTTASDSWINVTATDKGASLGGNVVWISPNEHDSNDSPSINVLTTDAKLWAWGHNHAGMLDGSSNATINPTYMPGSITGAYNKGKLNLTDKLIAVETGGHTSITIKECSTKFGYVGHRVRGSMADGTTGDNYEDNYNFSDTSALTICGALTGPVVEDLKICLGQTADLADAVPGTLPPGITIEWWTTIDKLPGTQVTNPSSVPAGTYYAFYVGANPVGIACPSAITIDNAACACYKPGLTTGGDVLDTKVGITSLSRAGADNPDNWPMIRKGGWIALESKTKGFVPNRVAFEDADSDPATPDVPVGIPAANFIEGMMVYDTTNKCMRMYTLKEGDTSMAWHCIATQTCPD